MGRRQFGREFELEAVRLVRKRGVSVAQASRDLDVGENVLRRWIKELTSDPGQAFPGQGQLKPERDILRRAAAYGRTAPGGSGMTCWPRVPRADCIASSG